MWLALGWDSRKVADIKRDSRVLVHSIVTRRDGSDGEYELRGRALQETDGELQARLSRQVEEQLAKDHRSRRGRAAGEPASRMSI